MVHSGPRAEGQPGKGRTVECGQQFQGRARTSVAETEGAEEGGASRGSGS